MKTKELKGLANEYKERESSGRARRRIGLGRHLTSAPLSATPSRRYYELMAMSSGYCYELIQTGLPGDCQIEYCGRDLPCQLHPIKGGK